MMLKGHFVVIAVDSEEQRRFVVPDGLMYLCEENIFLQPLLRFDAK